MSISVVVPTRDRPESLALCVAALEGQTVPVDIVVVEDSDGRGPASARNEGVRRASGELVCMTDDDCLPRPEWAARLAAALERADVVGGTTLGGPPGSVLAEATQLVVDHVSEREPFFPTMNLACRRDLLLREPFDERLHAAEDREWCARLAALGHTLALELAAVVEHRPEPSLASFLRRHYRYGRGARLYRRTRPSALPGRAPGFHRELLRAGFERSGPVGLAVLVSQAATAAGLVRETLASRR